MADINERIQSAIEELTGNEALFEMLEAEAAEEMMAWAKSLTSFVVRRTKGRDDFEMEQALTPRLKAVRQAVRSIGNWAAGKYEDPAGRVQLRDKLLDQFRTVFGEAAELPSPDEMDSVLNEVDSPETNAQQLILRLKKLLNKFNLGDSDHVATT